jgi:hypothetical protein
VFGLFGSARCSGDTKKDSKTIDLCNNPKHKEPKLDMAKRVIAGELFHESWVQLDEEVKGRMNGTVTKKDPRKSAPKSDTGGDDTGEEL